MSGAIVLGSRIAAPPLGAGPRPAVFGWPAMPVAAPGSRRPELAELAELSQRLAARRGGFIDILLAAARPFDDGFAPLRPLWTQEAAHRAIAVIRLSARLPGAMRPPSAIQRSHERGIARHLAGQLSSLDAGGAGRLACSGALREVARDLVALFGPAAGGVSVATDIVPLGLCAYRRRALVLLGHELVANALLHGFAGRRAGRLALRLRRPGPGRAVLQLCDDGGGFVAGRPRPETSLAGALADLLEGDLGYVRTGGWSTVAEIAFPVG